MTETKCRECRDTGEIGETKDGDTIYCNCPAGTLHLTGESDFPTHPAPPESELKSRAQKAMDKGFGVVDSFLDGMEGIFGSSSEDDDF